MLGEAIIYGLLVGAVTFLGFAIFAGVFSNILQNYLLKNIHTSWWILSLLCFSYYLWTFLIALLEGFMRFNAKALFMGGSYILKILSVYCGLQWLELDFDGLMLLMGSVETVVYLFITLLFMGKASHFRLNPATFKGMLKYSGASFPGTVSNFYTLRLDGFLLNYFSGPAAVGIYSVALNLIMMLLYLPGAIRTVLMPYIARFSEREITSKLSRMLVLSMILLSFFLIPLVWIAVIPIYGQDFGFSRQVFLLLVPGAVFWGVFALLSSDIEGRGRPGSVSIISMLSALATAGLGLIFIPLWNAVGAAMVHSVSHAITMFLAIRLYRRMIGIGSVQLLIPTVEDVGRFFSLSQEFGFNLREKLLPKYRSK